MTSRVFLAGASGAIGMRLVPLLRAAGYAVFGTTRSPGKVAALREAGATPVVVDVYDREALARAVAQARPEIVVHQLTDLAGIRDASRLADVLAQNARIRKHGTQHLVEAALAAGARSFIAQSIAWTYAPGREPHVESDALDLDSTGTRAITIEGVVQLERLTLSSPPLRGAVLRYGYVYGPGTGNDNPAASGPVLHVDAAAAAALLAIEKNATGIFNLAEEHAYLDSGRARRELGWTPGFRLA